MPNRMTILAIGAIIAIPLIFAALGASQAAGLAFGVALFVGGLVWMFAGSRGGDSDANSD